MNVDSDLDSNLISSFSQGLESDLNSILTAPEMRELFSSKYSPDVFARFLFLNKVQDNLQAISDLSEKVRKFLREHSIIKNSKHHENYQT